jgi:hypothetical protein
MILPFSNIALLPILSLRRAGIQPGEQLVLVVSHLLGDLNLSFDQQQLLIRLHRYVELPPKSADVTHP